MDESCLITDLNLVCMSEEIAEYYLERGEFPVLIVCDETLIHGRAVNRVLLELEQAVLRRIGEAEPGMEEVARSWFLRALELLVSASNYNNAAYSWSLRLPPGAEKPAPGFYAASSSLNGVQQDSFLWFYPSPGRAKAVGTIRWRENRVADAGGQRLAVPFILFGYILEERLLQLHQRIVEDLAELNLHFLEVSEVLLRDGSEAGIRRISETNDLVLCSLLSRKFWGGGMADSQPDWAAVARNYINFSENEDGGSIRRELERLWRWAGSAPEELLEEHLSLLLDVHNYKSFRKNTLDGTLESCRADAEVRRMVHAYQFSGRVRWEGQKVEAFTADGAYAGLITAMQEAMLEQLMNRDVCVECNPSSNYLIGSFRQYEQHPIFRFNSWGLTLPEYQNRGVQLRVSINTDDQGIFDTSLENEYALLYCALTSRRDQGGKRAVSNDAALGCLDHVRIMGLDMVFPPAEMQRLTRFMDWK